MGGDAAVQRPTELRDVWDGLSKPQKEAGKKTWKQKGRRRRQKNNVTRWLATGSRKDGCSETRQNGRRGCPRGSPGTPSWPGPGPGRWPREKRNLGAAPWHTGAPFRRGQNAGLEAGPTSRNPWDGRPGGPASSYRRAFADGVWSGGLKMGQYEIAGRDGGKKLRAHGWSVLQIPVY